MQISGRDDGDDSERKEKHLARLGAIQLRCICVQHPSRAL